MILQPGWGGVGGGYISSLLALSLSLFLKHTHSQAHLRWCNFLFPYFGVPVPSHAPPPLPSVAHLGCISRATDTHDGPAALWRHAKCASGKFYSQIMRVNHKSTAQQFPCTWLGEPYEASPRGNARLRLRESVFWEVRPDLSLRLMH